MFLNIENGNFLPLDKTVTTYLIVGQIVIFIILSQIYIKTTFKIR